MKNKYLTIRVKPETKKAIKQIALDMDTTITKILTDYIEKLSKDKK